MLKNLTLKNFVLVEALDITFRDGLTAITGESGAGKSILLNALGLLLGERARTEAVRPGASKADVSAEFDLSKLPELQRQLAQDELVEDDPAICIIRRVVSAQGRSRGFVNGIPVTTQYLRSLGHQLVDIHGQNEHLRLTARNTQLALLDDYAQSNDKRAKVHGAYHRWQTTLQEIAALKARHDAAADRQDLLTYQLQELQELDLQPGEFKTLQQQHKLLANAAQTQACLQSTLDQIEQADALRCAVSGVTQIEIEHELLTSAQDNLQTALGLLDDAGRDLRHLQDQVVADPVALQDLEARLNTVLDLARKHRIKPEALADHTQQLRAELDHFDEDTDALASLEASLEEQHTTYRRHALALSKKRRKAAPRFAAGVSTYMQQLGIGAGAFHIAFTDPEATAQAEANRSAKVQDQEQGQQRKDANAKAEQEYGIDQVEFQVTTNPDFPAGPLGQIASGGEQTRIALSIQIVAAEQSQLPCLILDEADVGVGGTTADTVGRILRDLGNHTQVICVTHAPQVAALGNSHLRVVKEGNHTNIQPLNKDRRVHELARMLAGADINDKTREYAQTLLHAANETPPRAQAGP